MFTRLRVALAAIILSGAAYAANLPLLSSTTPIEPSQIQSTINQLIQTINAGVGGLLNAQTGAASTTATTNEVTLQTYTLPANSLTAAGQSLRVTCWGTTGADANNKTVKLYFGASVISTTTYAGNAQNWYLDYIVMRTGAATQAFLGRGVAGTTSLTPVAVVNTAGTDSLTAAVVIKCTGTNGTASASDITATGMITELIK